MEDDTLYELPDDSAPTTDTEVEEEIPPPDPLLTLYIDQSADGQVDATVPVRWCLTPELVAEIERRGFTDPLLLVVARSEREGPGWTDYVDTQVQLVPLAREMTFVSFSRAGNNQICVAVIDRPKSWHERLRLKDCVDRYRQAGDSVFSGEQGELLWISSRVRHINAYTQLNVSVPREAFAAEPAQWRKSVVKAFFHTKEFDECHFRKRFWFFSIWAIVPAMIVILGVKLAIIALLLFFGRRAIDFKSLVRPLDFNVFDLIEDSEESVWTHKKRKAGYGDMHYYEERDAVFKYLNPPMAITVAAAFVAITQLIPWNEGDFAFMDWAHDLSWPMAALLGLAFWAAFGVFVLVLAVVIAAVLALFDALAGVLTRQSSRGRTRRPAPDRQSDPRVDPELLRELNAMVCRTSSGPPVVSVKALPKGKQTVVLRISDYKRRVCKTFAR